MDSASDRRSAEIAAAVAGMGAAGCGVRVTDLTLDHNEETTSDVWFDESVPAGEVLIEARRAYL